MCRRLLVVALVAFCVVVRADFCEYCETTVVSDASPSQISDQLDAWDDTVQDLYGDLSDLSIEMDYLFTDLSDLESLFDSGLAAAMAAAGYGNRYNNMQSLLADCFDQFDRINDQYNWLATHISDLELSLQDARQNIHYVTVSTNCTAQSHVGGGDGCGCECHCADYSSDIAYILSTLQAIEGNTYDCGSWLIDILTALQGFIGDARFSDFLDLPIFREYSTLTNAPYGVIDVPTDDFTRSDLESLNLWQRLNLYLYRQLDPGESPGSYDGDSAITDNVEGLENYTNSVSSLAAATTNSISALGPLADSVFNTLGAGTADASSVWRPSAEAHCPRRIVLWSGLDLLGVHVPGIGIDIGSSGASVRDGSVRTWSSDSLDDIVEYSRKVSIALWFVLISFPTVSIIVRNTGRIVKGVGIVIAFVHSLLK